MQTVAAGGTPAGGAPEVKRLRTETKQENHDSSVGALISRLNVASSDLQEVWRKCMAAYVQERVFAAEEKLQPFHNVCGIVPAGEDRVKFTGHTAHYKENMTIRFKLFAQSWNRCFDRKKATKPPRADEMVEMHFDLSETYALTETGKREWIIQGVWCSEVDSGNVWNQGPEIGVEICREGDTEYKPCTVQRFRHIDPKACFKKVTVRWRPEEECTRLRDGDKIQ